MLDTANYTPRLKTLYRETIRPAMKEEFGYANDMMIPRWRRSFSTSAAARKASGIPRRPNRPSRT
jgi:hypothetical protein